jgi:dsDNA-binding SOS-regulon protein
MKNTTESTENTVQTNNVKNAICSDLPIPNLFDVSVNHLDKMVSLQAKTQKYVYGYDYQNMSLREMMEFNHMNNHAIIDELHELTDSLGGIKDGDGSAIWKRWKSAYKTFENKKFIDLSESDQLEAKFEVVDIFHFVLAQCAMLNMDAKELFNMYMSKNKENIDRQNRGY